MGKNIDYSDIMRRLVDAEMNNPWKTRNYKENDTLSFKDEFRRSNDPIEISRELQKRSEAFYKQERSRTETKKRETEEAFTVIPDIISVEEILENMQRYFDEK